MKFKPMVLLTVLCGLQGVAFAAEQSSHAGAGSAEKGQAKAAPCVACHGVNGNSVNPEWPNLAGQHESYIKRQLAAFKSDARQNRKRTQPRSRWVRSCTARVTRRRAFPPVPLAMARAATATRPPVMLRSAASTPPIQPRN
jgi:hypothetical protein